MALPDADINRQYTLTLYDTGGYDTLDTSNHNNNAPGFYWTPADEEDGLWYRNHGMLPQRININPYHTSDIYNRYDNIVIGPDTWIERVIGGAGTDHITGNMIDNVIDAGPGDDVVLSGPEDDVLIGGAGADELDGHTGNDTAVYSTSPAGVDVRLAGNDTLTGGDGLDTADYSASGVAVIVRLHSLAAFNGHAEGDTFGKTIPVPYSKPDGSQHSELLPDIENLTGSSYDDVLAGDRRDNVIKGNAGDDKLYGGPGGGDDMMFGNAGNDTVYGGLGDDTLVGGPGNDTLIPGGGLDVLVFGPGDGDDTVRKFDPAQDKIDLTAFNLADDYRPELTQRNDDALINMNDVGGGSVLITDVLVADLDNAFIV